MTNYKFSAAYKKDAADLLQIYKYYVDNTTVSLDLTSLPLEEFTEKIIKTSDKYPVIKAVCNDRTVGFAYASEFNAASAYISSAQTAFYLNIEHCGLGLGGKLNMVIEEILKLQNITNIYGNITADNRRSLRFHEKSGYKAVGVYKKCGYKFDKWIDVVCMEKHILPLDKRPLPFIPFRELKKHEVNGILNK